MKEKFPSILSEITVGKQNGSVRSIGNIDKMTQYIPFFIGCCWIWFWNINGIKNTDLLLGIEMQGMCEKAPLCVDTFNTIYWSIYWFQKESHPSFLRADAIDKHSCAVCRSHFSIKLSTGNAEKVVGALELSCLFIFNVRERGHENLAGSLQPSIKNKSCCQRPKVLKSWVI